MIVDHVNLKEKRRKHYVGRLWLDVPVGTWYSVTSSAQGRQRHFCWIRKVEPLYIPDPLFFALGHYQLTDGPRTLVYMLLFSAHHMPPKQVLWVFIFNFISMPQTKMLFKITKHP